MKKFDVLLNGYYGMRNLGDDALLQSALQGVRHVHPEARIGITSPTAMDAEAVLPVREHFRGHRRLALYAAAARSKSIIFGGGSTLHCATDLDIKRHMLALAGPGPHGAIGIGVGPFASSRDADAAKRLLDRCAFVGVRDEESLQLCQQLDVQSRLTLTFDLAPALLQPIAKTPADARSGIVVSLCPYESVVGRSAHEEQRRIEKIAAVLNDVAALTGEDIVFLDFNGHPDLGDGATHARVQHLLNPMVRASRVPYHADPQAAIELLSRARCLIAMRLHAQIFGFMCGLPVVALNYHRKNWGWCDQVGVDPSLRFDSQNFSESALFSALIRGLKSAFPRPKLTPQIATERAQLNWSLLRETV